MPLSHLVRHFVLPPGSLLLLALAGFLVHRRHRRLGRGLVAASLVLLYLSSIPLVSGGLFASLEDQPALTQEVLARSRAGAIVVLGGGIYLGAPEYAHYGGLTTSHSSTFRTRYAAHLQRTTGLPVLCVGGGGPTPDRSEGQAMKDLLVELGVPADAIWMETTSLNTWQNALGSTPILRSRGVTTILLVTSAHHASRARFCFECLGFQVVPAPTGLGDAGYWSQGIFSVIPQAEALDQTSQALEEWSGRLAYWLSYRDEQTPQSP